MNTPHDSFESRLRHHMQSTPVDLPPAAGPHAAADRAAQRSRRRRTAVVSVAAVAVLGGMAPLVFGDDGDDAVNTEFASPVDGNGVELDWQVHDDGLAMVRSADEGADGFYAVSTGPGTRYEDFPNGDVPRALYRWDGSSWQVIDSADGSPDVAEMSERDGSLYALSTSPETGSPVGSVSTDGGATWTSVPLGSIEPPSDTVDWTLAVSFDIASTADTTVAVVNTRFVVPGDKLFAEDIAQMDSYTWRMTDDGVSLFDIGGPEDQAEADAAGLGDPSAPSTTAPPGAESEALVRTITWAELGVADGSALESNITTYRADGQEWTPISDGPAAVAAGDGLVATDTGILLQGWSRDDTGNARPVVFHTIDGTVWTAVATPSSSSGYGQTALAPNGAILHADDPGTEEFNVSVSTDLGATWAAVDIESMVPEFGEHDGPVGFALTNGPLGAAITMDIADDQGISVDAWLLFSPDLQSWTVSDLDEVMPDDTTKVTPALVGTDHIVVQAHGTGNPDTDEPAPTATLVATPVR